MELFFEFKFKFLCVTKNNVIHSVQLIPEKATTSVQLSDCSPDELDAEFRIKQEPESDAEAPGAGDGELAPPQTLGLDPSLAAAFASEKVGAQKILVLFESRYTRVTLSAAPQMVVISRTFS